MITSSLSYSLRHVEGGQHQLQGGVLQVCSSQVGLMQVTARQVAVLQVGPGQHPHPQVTILHVHVLQGGDTEIDT